jgi:hypothetical protein
MKQWKAWTDPLNKNYTKDIRDKLHAGNLAVLGRRHKTMQKFSYAYAAC